MCWPAQAAWYTARPKKQAPWPAAPADRRRPGIDESGITWGGSSAGRASRSQCEGREFDPPRLHHVKFPGCPKTSHEVQKALGIKAGNPRRRLSDGGGLYLLRNSGRFKRINNFLPTGGNCTAKNTPVCIKPGVFCLMEIPCRLETRYVDSSRRFTWGPAGRLANAGEAR